MRGHKRNGLLRLLLLNENDRAPSNKPAPGDAAPVAVQDEREQSRLGPRP
jgi:hypothetical protein